MRTNFTRKEIDAMPNLARMNVRLKAPLHVPKYGDPVFYYDSEGEMWEVDETEVGYAKTRFAPWG